MSRFLKKLLVFASILWVLNVVLGYVLTSPKRKAIADGQYFPIMRWSDFYERTSGTIDILFVGSSHAYRSFDTRIIDQVTGRQSFNLGSSGQSMVTSYFCVAEALRTQRPAIVVIECYPYAMFNSEQLKNGGFCFDGMKWSQNKLHFFATGFNLGDKIALTLFPAIRYRNNWRTMINRWLKKHDESTSQQNVSTRGEYQIGGYVSNDGKVSAEKLARSNHFDRFVFSPKRLPSVSLNYLEKTVRLCQSRGITVVLATAPLPQMTHKKIKGLDEWPEFFHDLAEELGVTCWDDLDGQQLDLVDVQHFFDNNHLNADGARIYSTEVASRLRSLAGSSPQNLKSGSQR